MDRGPGVQELVGKAVIVLGIDQPAQAELIDIVLELDDAEELHEAGLEAGAVRDTGAFIVEPVGVDVEFGGTGAARFIQAALEGGELRAFILRGAHRAVLETVDRSRRRDRRSAGR